MIEHAEYKLKTLRLAVSAMREHQHSFFPAEKGPRDRLFCGKCKNLEARVDKMVVEP
jgi:hypothetical protein